MGQYHKVYNIDKREYLHAHRLDNGLKLLEQVGWPGATSTALFMLLANSNGRGGGDASPHPVIGRWAGDRIVIQGDYAQDGDQAFIAPDDAESFEDISGLVKPMLDQVAAHLA